MLDPILDFLSQFVWAFWKGIWELVLDKSSGGDLEPIVLVCLPPLHS
jgi:hypothetical protein